MRDLKFLSVLNPTSTVCFKNFNFIDETNAEIITKRADRKKPLMGLTSFKGSYITAPFTRNELVQYLEERKITTRQLFCGNIIRHPSFQNVEYRVCGDLKNTDLIMNNTLWVGVYPGLTNPMIEYMIDTFKAFMKRYKK